MLSAEVGRSENVYHTRSSQSCPRIPSRQQRSHAAHMFEDQIKSPDYPCVGAKAAMQRIDRDFATFIAIFAGLRGVGERSIVECANDLQRS